jgi:hypothetical protein
MSSPFLVKACPLILKMDFRLSGWQDGNYYIYTFGYRDRSALIDYN